MKRIILIAGLFICLATSLFSQDATDESAVKLSDSVMEQVVKKIVTWYFKAPKKPKTINFASDNLKSLNIRKEWLPDIKNINFVMLEHLPARDEKKAYFFRETKKENNDFFIKFGYGNSCNTTGDVWSFRVSGTRIKLLKQVSMGWGMGCSAGFGIGSGHS